MKQVGFALAVLLSLAGCATQRAVDEKAVEAASCRTDLASMREKSMADLDACKEAGKEAHTSFLKDVEVGVQQILDLKSMEQQLREQLKNEIGAKDVEIERLRSQLSVRVMDRILFKSGSADILPGGLGVLGKVAGVIANAKETIRVEGHTDDVPIGPDLKKKYFSNWELSGARASSVVRYFQFHQHIDPARMEVVGFSEYRPVAPNDKQVDRQRNRRVEIVLTPWKPEAGSR